MAAVDVNVPSPGELLASNGNGEAAIDPVGADREHFGPLITLDGLLHVHGGAGALLARMREWLTVDPPVSRVLAIVRKSPPAAPGEHNGHKGNASCSHLIESDQQTAPFVASAAQTANGRARPEVPLHASVVGSATAQALAPDGAVPSVLTEHGTSEQQLVAVERSWGWGR